jgi:hypothetical protein
MLLKICQPTIEQQRERVLVTAIAWEESSEVHCPLPRFICSSARQTSRPLAE